MSYSHAADGLLAPRLQSALQRFAKPWWKRRAVRIFRDESSLSANPHLWSSITEALDTSGWFILLLSPDAATSEWVNQEIDYWVTNRDPRKILPVVTDGTFGWTHGDVDGDAVPPTLEGVFAEEPRWVDLRWARDEDQLDLKDPRFADAVADIASAIRGIPKDDLASEEVRQHRRTTRTAWAAGLLVTILAIAAVGFGIQSAQNADEAEHQAAIAEEQADAAQQNAEAEAEAREQAEEQRQRAEQAARIARAGELASASAAALDEDPELAILLGLESLHTSDTEPPGFLIDTIWRAAESNRSHAVLRPGTGGFAAIDLSQEGERLVAIDNRGTVAMYAVPQGHLLWSVSFDGPDVPIQPAFSPDGVSVVVSLADDESLSFGRREGNDDRPNRLVELDSGTGALVDEIAYPGCSSAMAIGWSSDASALIVSSGLDGCPREGASEHWVEVIDSASHEQIALHDLPEHSVGPVSVDLTASGTAFLFAEWGDPVVTVDESTFRDFNVVPDVIGIGGASPDGAEIITYSNQRSSGLARFDPSTGRQLDSLATAAFPSPMDPIEFSREGGRFAVATEGRDVELFDASTGQPIARLPGGASGFPRFSPDGQWLYTSHWDGSVRIWDLEPKTLGETIVETLAPTDHVNLGFALGPSLGAATVVDFETFEGRLQLFDRTDGQFVGQLPDTFKAVALADDRFATRPLTGEVLVHDPATGESVRIAGCVSTDGEVCDATGEPSPTLSPVTSLDQSELMIWNWTSGEWWIASPDDGSVLEAGTFPLEGREPIWFTEDWIMTSTSRVAIVVDRKSGERLALIDTPSSAFGIASRDRSTLVGAFAGSIDLLDVETLEARHFRIEFGRSRGIGLSPSGTRLAIGDENEILIVDLETETIERSIPIGGASAFDWLDEETLLLGTSFPARWITISLSEENLAADAASGLTRGFSESECLEYDIDPCPTLEEIQSR